MNTITIDDQRLVIEPIGLDRIWSFHSRLEFPLAHVVGATVDPGITGEPKGFRSPGLGLPGKWAGTFVQAGERSFWNVGAAGTPIVVRLRDEEWQQLVLSVDRPEAVVRRIESAIAPSA